MPLPALTARRSFALIIAALMVMSLLRESYCVYGPPLRNAAFVLLKPISMPLTALTAHIRGWEERPVLGDLEQLSEELRYKDALVIALQKQVRELELTNAELQGLSQRIGHDYRFREATVIGRSADPSSGTLQINIGAGDGVYPGLAVVSGANLVGRLVQVGPATSSLKPIIAKDELLTVMLAPPTMPREGLPAGRDRLIQLHVKDEQTLLADDVPRDVVVEVGDYARLMDRGGSEGWPDAVQGMLVGRVEQVMEDPDDPLRKHVIVQPLRSLRYMDTVTVVVPRHAGLPAGGDAP
ncbi:MAG: hypothetical protein GC162_09700 [Planctomycetes bacterium]|nr:hypothetical protein [Planctomycetota bacterium]